MFSLKNYENVVVEKNLYWQTCKISFLLLFEKRIGQITSSKDLPLSIETRINYSWT